MNNSLTAREREILRLLAEGFCSKEIAVKLNISLKTVETHKAKLYKKSGCGNVVTVIRCYYDFVEKKNTN